MLETIKVTNDDGEEAEFFVMEQTQLNGTSYLLATESVDQEELDAWIFKQIKTDDNDIFYETIEDENELEAVASVFEGILEDCYIEL